ncbi:MAG: hypothetical protein AAFW70_00430 [Cyanobacteria bacterium J06635_10]
MSKLEITDLSFCETELEDSGKVKGGMSSFFSYVSPSFYRFLRPIEEYDVEILEESVGEDGEKIKYFYDRETDSSGVEVSKETGSGKIMSTVVEGNINGGKFARSSAFASS